MHDLMSIQLKRLLSQILKIIAINLRKDAK